MFVTRVMTQLSIWNTATWSPIHHVGLCPNVLGLTKLDLNDPNNWLLQLVIMVHLHLQLVYSYCQLVHILSVMKTTSDLTNTCKENFLDSLVYGT